MSDTVAPKTGWLGRFARRLLTEQTTPARTGVAIALGIVIGTTPFFGLHLPACIVLATLFGLNRAITYLGANISFPPVYPLLALLSVQTGSLARRGELLPLTLDGMRHVDPWAFGVDWLVGSLILGPSIALPVGLITFVSMRSYRRRHPLA
jgi:uncharacterized protein (DUF2062 family)